MTIPEMSQFISKAQITASLLPSERRGLLIRIEAMRNQIRLRELREEKLKAMIIQPA